MSTNELILQETRVRSEGCVRFAAFPPALRRLLDVMIALTAITVFSPIIILVMAAIWLESGRPFLFSQWRLGQHGKYFRIHKFRKFAADSATNGCPLTVRNDNRMTPVGRFLEKSKFDELPQLWNVLRGDMAVVGPRPETPNFADCFESEFHGVLDHRPGIVGPSQTLFRNESSLYPLGADPVAYYRAVLFPIKARIDLSYYPSASVISDLGWIVRCALTVFGCQPACPVQLQDALGQAQPRGMVEHRSLADLVRQLIAEHEAGMNGAAEPRARRVRSVPPQISTADLSPAAATPAIVPAKQVRQLKVQLAAEQQDTKESTPRLRASQLRAFALQRSRGWQNAEKSDRAKRAARSRPSGPVANG